MCFSAEASFTGAAIIGAVGILTLRQVTERRQLFLALIPLFFAFQQLLEGFLWLSQGRETALLTFAKYMFLSMALFLWPIWISLALFAVEPVKKKKLFLGLFLFLGILYDLLFLHQFYLIWPKLPQVQFFAHHIHYITHIPEGMSRAWLYSLLVLLPQFFSSLPYIKLFTLLNGIALAIAHYFYFVTEISIWCFISAWISLGIYVILHKFNSSK